MRTNSKNNKILIIAAFLLPMLLLAIIYAIKGIAPFGNNTLAYIDAKGQYISFFKYYRDIFIGKQDIFYMFEKNLGGSAVGFFAYYLASPLNLIFILFPEEKILTAFDILILIKLSLCALTCAIFLGKRKELSFTSLMFTTAYSLCGYNVAYCWSVMWIDGVILLPLIALGINQIAESKKPYLYIFSLSVAIITSFYIGYALCIFSVLYYSYISAIKPNKSIKEFIMSSLSAGGISAFLLLPTIFSFSGGKRESGMSIIKDKMSSLHEYALSYLKSDLFIALACIIATIFVLCMVLMIIRNKHRILAISFLALSFAIFYLKIEYFLQGDRNILIKMLFGNINYSEVTEGSPNIYVGGLVLMLLISYFFCSNIPKRERICSGVFCAVLLLSFALFIPNLIWHGFTKNTWFNYRYSFIYCFLVIILAEKAFDEKFNLASLGALIIVIFAALKQPSFVEKWQLVYVSAMLLVYVIVMLLKKKNLAAGIQILALFITAFMSISVQTADSMKTDEYEESFLKYRSIIEEIEDADDGFYRIRKYSPWISYNDPITFGYNGISHFSSTEKTEVIEYLKEQGYFTYENIYACADDNKHYDADDSLGVKYYIDENNSIIKNEDAKSIAYIEDNGNFYNTEVKCIKDSKIQIETNTVGKLIVTIPYEKSWHVFIDGEEKTELNREQNIFFSIQIGEGNHTLILKYVPEGLYIGILISIVTLILTIVVIETKKRKPM